MRLEKLELFGFKSFADKTEFEFPRGITVVVGPNGAGKSNIVDAVRWVLGEQRPKSLRGSQMQDVIFSGTPGRHAAGYAEVTLCFSNADRAIPLDFETVAVTRRLYRTGESEYLLNRQACRLKDIRELFMDTGVGSNAYSVVEQGKVDILLESSPERRRVVFDEAAGISKYRARRKEAESKLARTDENLLRVSDITAEVDKQLRSVKLQASKARRYKEYAERLAALRLRLYMNDYDAFRRRAGELSGEIKAIGDRMDGLSARTERLQAEATGLKVDLAEHDETVAQLGSRKAAIASEAELAAERANSARARISEAESDGARARDRLEAASDRKLRQEQALKVLEQDLHSTRNALDAEQRRHAQADEAYREADLNLARKRQTIQAHRAKVVELLDAEARLRNSLGRHDSRLAALAASRGRLEDELERTVVRMGEAARDLLAARTRRACVAQKLAAFCAKRAHLVNETDAVRRRLTEADRELVAVRQRLALADSRMKVLAELQRRREGLSAGAREILDAGSRLNGIVGLLADVVEVDTSGARAVEAVLGARVDAIVTETTADALAAVKFLHEHGEGPAVLIPMDGEPPRDLPQRADRDAPNASGLVQRNGRIPPAVDALLSNTLLVESIEDICPDGLDGARLVTAEGDLVESDGSIVACPPRASGPLARMAELDELGKRMGELKAELDDAQGVLERWRARRADLEDALARAEQHIAAGEAEHSRVAERMGQLENDIAILQCRRGVVRSEIAEAAAEADELSREAARLTDQLDETVRSRQAREAAAGALSAGVAEAEDALRAAGKRLNDVRVRRAELAQKVAGLEDSAGRLRQAVAERESDVLACRQEITATRERALALAEEVRRHEAQLVELGRKNAEVEKELSQAADARSRVAAALARVEKEVSETESSLRELEAERTQKRFDLQEVELRESSLAERAREDLGVDLAEQAASYEPETADWDAIKEEMNALKLKIERLGSVNVDAIAELDEIEKRRDFLRSQQSDLLEAKASLNQAIRRLDEKSKELFFASFREVREHFQDIFRKLFGGGRADVFLLDEADPLNCGIEIVAKPPGKEPQSIALLSGGEKAMTAVALVFAIFKSRPSPFCVLDEVDAALDENNIARFLAMLREFLDKSQFVIVTHSKKTMAVGDVLYGITMQEDGVSKKIEVRFDRIEPLIA